MLNSEGSGYDEGMTILAVMTWGEFVRKERERKRLTASECASRAGFKIQQWSRMESDEPRRKDGTPPVPKRSTVEIVAAVLEIPLKRALLYAASDYTEEAIEEHEGRETFEDDQREALLALYDGIDRIDERDELVQMALAKWRKLHPGERPPIGD